MASITPPPPLTFLAALQQYRQEQKLDPQAHLAHFQHQHHHHHLASSSSFSSFSSSSPPSSTSSAQLHQVPALLLDMTTVQGLFLYTLYLLHRLRFFRWRDTRKLTLWNRLSFRQRILGLRLGRELAASSSFSSTASSSSPLSLTSSSSSSEKEKEKKRFKSRVCINHILPSEILVLILGYLSRSRQLRCTTVCRSWYELLGPQLWKCPRVLWSRHWSRFHPLALPLPLTLTHLSANIQDENDHNVCYTGNSRIMIRHPPLMTFASLEEAYSSGGLHDLDRQEMDQWFDWKRREKSRRVRLLKKRSEQRLQQQHRHHHGHGQRRVLHGRHHHQGTATDSGSESETDEDQDESGSDESMDSEGEEEGEEEDASSTDSDRDGDSDEGESPLMKIVAGMDYFHSLLTSLTTTTTAATVPTSESFVGSSPSRPPLQPDSHPTFHRLLPFPKTVARFRRRQQTRECRQRLAEIRETDGLPMRLPLETCGRWIQVLNLQQDAPFLQRIDTHALVQQHQEEQEELRLLQQQQEEQLNSLQTLVQADQSNTLGGFLRTLFGRTGDSSVPATQGPLTTPLSTAPSSSSSSPKRLLTRRDFITDATVQTILQYCPGLCRLNLSECHAITDKSLALIRSSTCLRQGTLISLHLAGCWQLTDRALENLLFLDVQDPVVAAAGQNGILRLESLDLAGCHQITDQGLIPLLRQCPRLSQLRLSDCSRITSKSVEVMAACCPGIKWLDLARSGPLTDPCLILLAENCTGLEWLNLARSHPQEEEEEEEDEDNGDEHIPQHLILTHPSSSLHHHQNQDPSSISDASISLLCESCPNLQLLDLSYISTLTNTAIITLSETAHSLVCLTIIGCSGITSQSLLHLAKLRATSGRLGCITMGDALGISEQDIEQIMQGTLSGWQKSLVDDTSLGEILGRSWDD